MFTLVAQGAEAKLYTGYYDGRPVIVKERFRKDYRHPTLDERLTKERLRAELRGIQRAKAVGIRTPAVYFVDGKRNSIYMERIDDVDTVNVAIGKLLIKGPSETGGGDADAGNLSRLKALGHEIGVTVGKLHAADIIHGDLTTSNILVKKGTQDLVLIDFGLSHMDDTTEDKGVDLYVLERALASTHSSIPWIFDDVLEGYKRANIKDGVQVLRKLDEVRLRGRKRTMVG